MKADSMKEGFQYCSNYTGISIQSKAIYCSSSDKYRVTTYKIRIKKKTAEFLRNKQKGVIDKLIEN